MDAPEENSSDLDLVPLVEAARKDDEVAISELISLTQDSLYRFFLYLCGDSSLAQDLSQDTYVRAFDKLDKLKESEKFKSWLFRLGKNLFIDHLRANKKHQSDELDESRHESQLAGVEPDQRDLIMATRQVLETMDESERIVLVLVDMEGRSYQEAADVLEISESALRSRLHRARKAFLIEFEKK
jgi:RNA polymerase sigma-70 factor (ECF subfamily)